MGRHLPRPNYKLCTHTGRVKSWGKSQRGQKISQNREKGRGREFVDPLQLDPGFSTMRRFLLAPLNLGQCTRNPSPLSPLAKTPSQGYEISALTHSQCLNELIRVLRATISPLLFSLPIKASIGNVQLFLICAPPLSWGYVSLFIWALFLHAYIYILVHARTHALRILICTRS